MRIAGVVVTLAVVLSASCVPGPEPGPGPLGCRPVSWPRPFEYDAARFVGRYTFVVVANGGPEEGQGAIGELELMPYPAWADSIVVPGRNRFREGRLMGFTSVDFAKLGVRAIGRDPASRDPMVPGIRVGQLNRDLPLMMNIGGPLIDIGIGADVLELTATGFRGRWGAVQGGDMARGYFCAIRQVDDPAR